MQDVIATKFQPPVWMGSQLRRDALLKRLDQALRHRLTLVHAPAGYGKTSLLAQWREHLDPVAIKAVWLTLERDDRDLKRLIAYLSRAVQEDGEEGREKAFSSDLPPSAAMSAIVNGMASESRPFVLILDDLHHAESAAVVAFLRSLIRLSPSNCHFVFASRDYPKLGQSVLAAEEQLLEITARDLRFSEEEAESLLSRVNASVSGADLARILDRTEGWPIAVQLTSLSLKRGVGQEQVIWQHFGTGTDLARYLSEQVLITLPEDIQDVVLRTSLLDRLNGDLVDLLCDRKDGWLVLERLEQQGVFITPVTTERREYRYHQLFAEFLRNRFERSDKAAYSNLQERLARWFAARGRVADAVNHATLADDPELLASVMEEAGGWRLIPQGQQSVVERGLSALPKAEVRSRPRLALAQVYLQIKTGELGAARAEFDRVIEAAKDADLSADMRTEVRVVGDTLADYENQPVTFDDLIAREALLRKLPANDHLVLANISETLGAKYFEGGWLERALQPSLAAREHYQALGSVYSDLFTRFLEARIKRAQGRSKDAETILQSAWETIVSNFGDRSDLAANCAAFLSELLFEQDRVPEACALLDWALPHMEQSDGWVDVYSVAYFTQAFALASDGDLEEATVITARARRMARRRLLQQLELLTNIVEVDIQVFHGASLEYAFEAAERINLDELAATMREESPHYRPVAVAASLCRIRLLMLDGEFEQAMQELDFIRTWANQRGAGRLLIDVNILAAHGHRSLDAPEEARACFDEAVGIAMFQGIVRPFVESRRFAKACLEDAMSVDSQVDRFRAQFLKQVSKSIAACRNAVTVLGQFSESEAEVLFYLSQGHSNKEIARLINMSTDTVKYRLKLLFRKIGVSKRRDAVRVLAERGLVPQNPSVS